MNMMDFETTKKYIENNYTVIEFNPFRTAF